MKSLFGEYDPAIMQAVTLLVLAILSGCTVAVTAWFKRLKDKIEEGKDREALHAAMKTGAIVGNEKFPGDAKEAVGYAVDYAMKSVPDAIKNLTHKDDVQSEEVLGKLATSKVIEAKEAK